MDSPSSFQSGEKTALVTAILVSQTLYYSLVIESIPANSVTLPLLGRQEKIMELITWLHGLMKQSVLLAVNLQQKSASLVEF